MDPLHMGGSQTRMQDAASAVQTSPSGKTTARRALRLEHLRHGLAAYTLRAAHEAMRAATPRSSELRIPRPAIRLTLFPPCSTALGSFVASA